MKLKARLFGKTFFEIESEDAVTSEPRPVEIHKPDTQLNYEIGEEQYKNLKKVSDF